MARLAGKRKGCILTLSEKDAGSARKRKGRKRKHCVRLSPPFLILMRKSPGDILNFIHCYKYVSLLSELALSELCFTANFK